MLMFLIKKSPDIVQKPIFFIHTKLTCTFLGSRRESRFCQSFLVFWPQRLWCNRLRSRSGNGDRRIEPRRTGFPAARTGSDAPGRSPRVRVFSQLKQALYVDFTAYNMVSGAGLWKISDPVLLNGIDLDPFPSKSVLSRILNVTWRTEVIGHFWVMKYINIYTKILLYRQCTVFCCYMMI